MKRIQHWVMLVIASATATGCSLPGATASEATPTSGLASYFEKDFAFDFPSTWTKETKFIGSNPSFILSNGSTAGTGHANFVVSTNKDVTFYDIWKGLYPSATPIVIGGQNALQGSQAIFTDGVEMKYISSGLVYNSTVYTINYRFEMNRDNTSSLQSQCEEIIRSWRWR